MTFRSILFPNATDRELGQEVSEPEYFSDLVLDQVVAAITASKAEYDLSGFFHAPLRNVDDISFRQEVMQDLEQPQLLDHIRAFSSSIKTMRQHLELAEKLHYRYQKDYWVLDAATIYAAAVPRLADALSDVKVASRGLLAFKDYVSRHIASRSFTSLVERTNKLTTDLSEIHYNLLIKGTQVEVRHHQHEPDYSAGVDATFQKFEKGAVKGYLFDASDSAGMNHVEAAILGLVAKLYPAVFSDLENYVADYRNFADAVIVQFDREIQFYIAYLEFIGRFRNAGLNFCYPRVTRACKEVYDYRGFDIALADRLVGQNDVPICNDFHLKGRERLVIVSGPNQGGKTTFARTFGQLHYLGSLGCPVPGTKAQLFLFSQLFTHFERQEDIGNLRGKLQDDLIRVHNILERATSESIIILNEVFTSTTFRDASVLSRNIAERILQLDLLCIWVTFVDELASLGEETVSMVSTVVPDNPAQRTYKIVRQPADGLAYAMSIAEKHRLTHDLIRRRLKS